MSFIRWEVWRVGGDGVKDLGGGNGPVLFARSMSLSSSSQKAALFSDRARVRVGVRFCGLVWAFGVTGRCGSPLPKDWMTI